MRNPRKVRATKFGRFVENSTEAIGDFTEMVGKGIGATAKTVGKGFIATKNAVGRGLKASGRFVKKTGKAIGGAIADGVYLIADDIGTETGIKPMVQKALRKKRARPATTVSPSARRPASTSAGITGREKPSRPPL